eukprot:2064936-Prymnesium_polylepis.1
MATAGLRSMSLHFRQRLTARSLAAGSIPVVPSRRSLAPVYSALMNTCIDGAAVAPYHAVEGHDVVDPLRVHRTLSKRGRVRTISEGASTRGAGLLLIAQFGKPPAALTSIRGKVKTITTNASSARIAAEKMPT